jgi:hypothetical protein
LWKGSGCEAQKVTPLVRFPPINQGYVQFIASDSSVHDVPEKWLSQARTIDPDLRLIPGPDANAFVLTAEDRAFLWCSRIESP